MYTFPLKFLIHVSRLSTNEPIKNVLAPSALALAIHLFFKPCHSRFTIFHAKMVLWENIYMLIILYSEVNHTLFGEKLYFIWKLRSGNTDFPNNEMDRFKISKWEVVLVNINEGLRA